MATALTTKLCLTCGVDLNGQKRVKDPRGNYYCHVCWDGRATIVSVAPSAIVPAEHGSDKPADLPKAAPRRNTTLRRDLSLALWVLGLLLGTAGLIFGGEAKVFVKNHPDFGVAQLLVIVPLFAMFLLPFVILWTFLHCLTDLFFSRSPARRAVAGTISVFALIVGIAGYSRYISIAGMLNAKPSNMTFVEFDSQFGLGIVGNPSLMTKTGEQADAALKQYLGSMVKWKGVVIDVTGEQVLIEHRSSTMTNEVALLLGWWDEPILRSLNKGDVVEYTGVINNIGSPYPYTLVNGTIAAQHGASDEEQHQLLKENDTAVLDRMYQH